MRLKSKLQASPSHSDQKGVKGGGRSKSREGGKQRTSEEKGKDKGSRAESSGPHAKGYGKVRAKDDGDTDTKLMQVAARPRESRNHGSMEVEFRVGNGV